MDLEKLQELADKDLKINDTELDLESLKTPQLHNKYMKHLTKFKLMLSRAEGDLYNAKRELWEYYTGKADASVYAEKPFNLKILKQDVDQYIYSDERYIKAKQKVDYAITEFECTFNKTEILRLMIEDGFGELNWEDLKASLNKISLECIGQQD